MDPYLFPPTHSQAAPSQGGSRRPDDGSVVSSRQGAYGIRDQETLAGSTAGPRSSNTPGNGLSDRGRGPRSQASDMYGDNNVTDAQLRPSDSQSQYGIPRFDDEKSRRGAGSEGDDDRSSAVSDKENFLFASRKKAKPGGPKSSAGQSKASNKGSDNTMPGSNGLSRMGESSQTLGGDASSAYERQPVPVAGNDEVDKWMREAREMLDHAKRRVVEGFVDRKIHAAWLSSVDGLVAALDSSRQMFSEDHKDGCDRELDKISSFLDDVRTWPLREQPPNDHGARTDSSGVQETSKHQEDTVAKESQRDSRGQGKIQAGETGNTDSSNNKSEFRGGRSPPPKANHRRRGPEQGACKSHIMYNLLISSCVRQSGMVERRRIPLDRRRR
jgi:hypothetical protein